MRRKSLTLTSSDILRQRGSMMASPCIPLYLLLPLWLVFNMTRCFAVTESDGLNLSGEVDGSVTVHCPYDKQKTIKFLYFQKGKTFVNGFHAKRDISDGKSSQPWENTRMENKTTVHMSNLNVSHSGSYVCHIMYIDAQRPSDTYVHLRVTANYSKPEATVKCSDGLSCQVTCASHGGYPSTEMMWRVPGSQIWKIVNSSQMPDPVTKMVNSTSTANFNCSNGELKHLSCYVGEVTSDMFSVCTPEVPPDQSSPYVIPVAICAVVIFTLPTVVLLCWKCKKSQTNGQAVTVMQEWQENERQDEVVQLNENQGEEAP